MDATTQVSVKDFMVSKEFSDFPKEPCDLPKEFSDFPKEFIGDERRYPKRKRCARVDLWKWEQLALYAARKMRKVVSPRVKVATNVKPLVKVATNVKPLVKVVTNVKPPVKAVVPKYSAAEIARLVKQRFGPFGVTGPLKQVLPMRLTDELQYWEDLLRHHVRAGVSIMCQYLGPALATRKLYVFTPALQNNLAPEFSFMYHTTGHIWVTCEHSEVVFKVSLTKGFVMGHVRGRSVAMMSTYEHNFLSVWSVDPLVPFRCECYISASDMAQQHAQSRKEREAEYIRKLQQS